MAVSYTHLFTTTGATILDHIETLPHGLLFWRSLTQWIGGLGIVSKKASDIDGIYQMCIRDSVCPVRRAG